MLPGLRGRVALSAGLSLAQIGELSFALAGLGVSSHAIPSSLTSLVLATALVTIVLSPVLLQLSPVLTVLLPDALAAERATRAARALHPDLAILTRARDATDVVQREFEAGVAVVGYVLRHYGLSGPDLARFVVDRRADFYRRRTRSP